MMFADLTEMPLSIVFLLCGLATLSLYFTLRFVFPAVLLLVRIRRAIRHLRRIAVTEADDADVDTIFKADLHLARSWRNYRKTLAPASRAGGGRATMPASVCFDRQENVEIPMKLEFFRHCPGLMTSIGIFGTFSGLLFGLHRFAAAIVSPPAAPGASTPPAGPPSHDAHLSNPDGTFSSFGPVASAPAPPPPGLKVLDQIDDGATGAHHMGGAAVAHASAALRSVVDANTLTVALGRLLHSVSDAFVVSAIAVLCAFFTTFFEKLLMAYCFQHLQELSSTIDKLFDFSPGDDPMTRLTRSSEATEKQTRRIALSLDGIAISRDRSPEAATKPTI
ncbi:hypothetical protein OVY01_08280 [Robbsia sp. Bb-Pol-6]|uniref:Uncharacterized protein n=1 Tax=Robbsia betulipollinis TaxID=2981849 RepID=A0ABT3ZL22_9BURK|nr:hypothetical protein [Robbsia betulipollinis]MCY0387229.1 hypothetical protein [Robbsia betulipollinis]